MRDTTARSTSPRLGWDTGRLRLSQVLWPWAKSYADRVGVRKYHCANNPTTAPRKDPRRMAGKARLCPYPRATSLEATAGCREVNNGDSYTIKKSWKARFPLAQCTTWVAQCISQQHNTFDPSTQGLGSSSPSPTLLVSPYYKQYEIWCCPPLLDVRLLGRNQDKSPPPLSQRSTPRGTPADGVATRDVIIDPGTGMSKFPLIVYYHGGAFSKLTAMLRPSPRGRGHRRHRSTPSQKCSGARIVVATRGLVSGRTLPRARGPREKRGDHYLSPALTTCMNVLLACRTNVRPRTKPEPNGAKAP
ncbi:hypothetical protein HU200_008673 [Digitaria exilis]|uniref:Uncharacterized protein n=1 Tax=Digitaria exilis TaxID=1010633 RepID=A0A835KRG0_9POAL|nr:hypothetical protein HU200_008673 [Digitaria exilis]